MAKFRDTPPSIADRKDLILEGRGLAKTPQMHQIMDCVLCDAIALSYLPMNGWNVGRLKQVAKGILKLATVKDPLTEFWRFNKDKVFKL